MLDDRDTGSSPSQNNEFDNSAAAYMRRAVKASSAGDVELALHLYLAAYERGSRENEQLSPDAAHALRRAWMLACQLKERALAEYIFEKLEPLLDPNELSICAEQLQRMALDKLEEFGLSREDLQEMTDMISQDFFGFGGPGNIMKVEHVTLPPSVSPLRLKKAKAPADANVDAGSSANLPAEKPATPEAEGHSPVMTSSDGVPGGKDAEGAAADAADQAQSQDALPAEEQDAPMLNAGLRTVPASDNGDVLGAVPEIVEGQGEADADDPDAHARVSTLERISYSDIAGFQRAVSVMRNFGIGMQDDPEFQSLVSLLNQRHGFDRMPAADSMLFRSPAREDAHRFMTATLGEIDLPAIRMHMEENLQGMPVLCVMAQADNHPRLNSARNAFEGPGVLLLEDLDLWIAPTPDGGEDFGGFMFPGLSRGAREAINLIRSAVENPEVFVLASASDAGEIDSFFFELLEPLTVIDIDYPDEAERDDIWMDIAREHPSLRGIDRAQLVKFSAGMPRYDMYMAARESLEDAYKLSLMQRSYVPVSPENLFEKLAAYQPLESGEYQALEDAVIERFRRELDDNLDDLLKGGE